MEVLTAESVDAAVSLGATGSFDVALIEASAGGGGAAALTRLGKVIAGSDVIVIAAPAALEIALAIGRERGIEVLAKPFPADELPVLAVRRAVARRVAEARASREAGPATEAGEPVVAGKDMRAVVERALSVASADVPLSILGEPGTGKSLLAELVRRHDRRRNGPWSVLAPAAMSPSDVEDALGGPTDVAPPAFEDARGGTLVIDDLAALPSSAQASLSSHLDRVASADVPRLIALGGADLSARVKEGSLRRDLFFRLGAVTVTIPPLRRRREELPVLAHHFLVRAAPRVGSPARRFGVEALKRLLAEPWPGNVRELEAVVLRAATRARGETIVPSDLDMLDATPTGAGAPISLPTGTEDLPYADAKKQLLAAFDAAYLGGLLAAAGGNVSEAARRAGLDRSNFRRLMRKRK
jgi:DNA-binding NtrC family response regulator